MLCIGHNKTSKLKLWSNSQLWLTAILKLWDRNMQECFQMMMSLVKNCLSLVKMFMNMCGECLLILSIIKHFKLLRLILCQIILGNGLQVDLSQVLSYKNLWNKVQNGHILTLEALDLQVKLVQDGELPFWSNT